MRNGKNGEGKEGPILVLSRPLDICDACMYMEVCAGGHSPPNVMRQVFSKNREHAFCPDWLPASSRDPLVSASSTLGLLTRAPLYLMCTGLFKDLLGSSCLCDKHHSDSAIRKTPDRGEHKLGKYHTASLWRVHPLLPSTTGEACLSIAVEMWR